VRLHLTGRVRDDAAAVPVRCDYCQTVELARASNCRSCGGPLPIPEVRETVIERRIDISREVMDVSTMGDLNRVFVVGRKRAEAIETSVLSERVRRAS
jgi:hypothetical protein